MVKEVEKIVNETGYVSVQSTDKCLVVEKDGIRFCPMYAHQYFLLTKKEQTWPTAQLTK